MVQRFWDIAGFSATQSYWLWAAIVFFIVIVLAITSFTSAFQMQAMGDMEAADFITFIARVLVLFIFFAWLISP